MSFGLARLASFVARVGDGEQTGRRDRHCVAIRGAVVTLHSPTVVRSGSIAAAVDGGGREAWHKQAPRRISTCMLP